MLHLYDAVLVCASCPLSPSALMKMDPTGHRTIHHTVETGPDVECTFVKDDAALVLAVQKCDDVAIILDERGPTCNSVQFSDDSSLLWKRAARA